MTQNPNDFINQARLLCSQLTIDEKLKLCSGKNYWQTVAVNRLNIPSITMADGPHGIRRQKNFNKMELITSIPSTCFPPAVTAACTFDTELLYQMGKALGTEARNQQVNLVLGPGINIKRDPRCGRNFEYFSEDPVVTSTLASAMIKGIQSVGVGSTVKHYLGNNQENFRMTSNSIIDERALNEIYLKVFIDTIKVSQPWAVMTSYNMVNDYYTGEHPYLLKETLRSKLGYTGLVMTDWGAMNDPIASINNGLDLEMPSSSKYSYRQLKEALKQKKLDLNQLDNSVTHVIALALAVNNEPTECDYQAHHELARQIAREGAVLLENDGILPLRKSDSIALIGTMAKHPRIQGAGSSKVTPTHVTTIFETFHQQQLNFIYSDGMFSRAQDNDKTAEMDEIVKNANTTIVVIGLPEADESEGFDREHLNLPETTYQLVDHLSKITDRLVVVMMCGGVVNPGFNQTPNAILQMHLSGQNNGSAVFDLLFGDYSPCGKLAETYPLQLEDVPTFGNFGHLHPQYLESIHVGYRYYTSNAVPVRYPFGHGLTYTKFLYHDLKINNSILSEQQPVSITCSITNIGDMIAKEVVQLYITQINPTIDRPALELKHFQKIELAPQSTKEVHFLITTLDLAYYNTTVHEWQTKAGDYEIIIASSSQDHRLSCILTVFDESNTANEANTIQQHSITPVFKDTISSDQDGKKKNKTLTNNSPLADVQHTMVGRLVFRIASRAASASFNKSNKDAIDKMLLQMPLRAFVMYSNGLISHRLLERWINHINKKISAVN